MRILVTICSFVLILSSVASMQAPPAERRPPANENIATLLTAGAIREQLAKMTADRPNQEYTIVERVGVWRLSIEHRKLPQRPAIHQQEGEMWVVIDGNATIRTGGKIEGAAAPTAATATQAAGNVFGKTIVGGTDHKVGPGDFLLVPENVPHEIVAASPTLKFIVFEVTRPK